MKKSTLIVLTCSLVLVAGVGTFWYSRGARAMPLGVSVKDFPKHGLKIIGPSDPAFEGALAGLARGQRQLLDDSIRPFCVFVENQGDQDVVGYRLRWTLTRADGQSETYANTYINPGTFVGAVMPGGGAEGRGRVIKRGSTRLLSFIPSLDLEEEGGVSQGAGGVSTENREAAAQISQGVAEAVKRRDQAALIASLRSKMSEYTDVTISIEGAFYEDGTFVGPKGSKFFEQVEAYVDARHDLLRSIVNDLVQHKSVEEIYARLKAAADDKRGAWLSADPPPADVYNHFRRSYAQQILRGRQIMGDRRALETELRSLRNPGARLKRAE